jgi:Flp pilus assembly protein TadG
MRNRSGEGQAAVELALAVPIVATLLLAVVQVSLLVRDQILVTHAAREAARQAAVDPSPQAARQAALHGAPLEEGRVEVTLSGSRRTGERIEAMVAYRAPTAVPLVGPLAPDPILRARASMKVE